MSRYPWEYEEIEVGGQLKRFVVVSAIDLPVELVSDDGELYALWIRDERDGELWFLIEVENKKHLADYLKGIKPIGAVFESKNISVVRKNYDAYDVFELTEINPESYPFPDLDTKIRIKDYKLHESFARMFKKPFRNLLKFTPLDITNISLEKHLNSIGECASPMYKQTLSTSYELSMVA